MKGIRNIYTGREYIFDNREQLEAFCNGAGIKLNTLERAKREDRKSLIGFELIDPNEASNVLKTAIVVSDLHFCYEDKDAVNILYQILADYKDIDEFIDLGDGVNNQALSGYVSYEPEQYTLYREIEAYSAHMDIVKNILPDNVKFVVTEDNHFHLRKKRFLSENPAFVGLLPDLSNVFDEEVPHGKLYFPFGQERFGCIHGVSFAKYFTRNHLDMYGKYDVIAGHTHTVQTFVSSSGTNYDEPRRSYGVPSMCKRMEYTNGVPTRQVIGFSFITYDTDTDNYNLERIIIEKGATVFRGKKYVSDYKNNNEVM